MMKPMTCNLVKWNIENNLLFDEIFYCNPVQIEFNIKKTFNDKSNRNCTKKKDRNSLKLIKSAFKLKYLR